MEPLAYFLLFFIWQFQSIVYLILTSTLLNKIDVHKTPVINDEL